MILDVLPVRTGGAAEHMAHDFLLLQRYPRPDAARFRHYEWRGPAWTFGYGQAIEFVRTQLPPEARDLSRRPTGGGVVDHTADWTYALVVPRGHALHGARALEAYRAVHQCLAKALAAQGVPAILQPPAPPEVAGAAAVPGVCFRRAEPFDVVHRDSGAKLAGAAQKRNKQGLLVQGSVWRPAAGAVDWEEFGDAFVAGVAELLGATLQHPGWPEWDYDEEQAVIERFAAPEWIESR